MHRYLTPLRRSSQIVPGTHGSVGAVVPRPARRRDEPECHQDREHPADGPPSHAHLDTSLYRSTTTGGTSNDRPSLGRAPYPPANRGCTGAARHADGGPRPMDIRPCRSSRRRGSVRCDPDLLPPAPREPAHDPLRAPCRPLLADPDPGRLRWWWGRHDHRDACRVAGRGDSGVVGAPIRASRHRAPP